jgi:hypothetical protein
VFSRSGSTAKHVPALLKKAKSAAVRGVAPSPTAMKASSSVKPDTNSSKSVPYYNHIDNSLYRGLLRIRPAQSFARNFLYASQMAIDSEISFEFGNSFICGHGGALVKAQTKSIKPLAY